LQLSSQLASVATILSTLGNASEVLSRVHSSLDQ
jgi:hypothetical protein